MKKSLLVALLYTAVLLPLHAVDLIKDGKLTFDAVVLSPKAYSVMVHAANEIVYHLKLATGQTLPVISDREVKSGGRYIFIGNCWHNTAKLDTNAGIIEIGSNFIKIAGKDGRRKYGSPNNSAGTLFAAYEFLEKFIGVRWIWPGKSGEIVPQHKNLVLKEQKTVVVPVLKSSRWRTVQKRPETWSSAQIRDRFYADQRSWMLRHRFVSFSFYDNGHAFGKYFTRYGKTNPEFFSLLPDGTRRPNPYMWSKGYPRDVSMCTTSTGLIKTIVKNYIAAQTPNRMINVNENDTAGECVCSACLKADNSNIPDDVRLKKAKELFAQKKTNWEYDSLGSLSDRYASFYLAVQKEAEKQNIKNPVVAGLIYANYSEPPTDKIKLNERIHLRFCPPYMYPWTQKKIDEYKNIWGGWAKAGASLQFRPNYTLDGNCFPVQYHEAFYDMYTFSAKNGMVAVDMDSYTGHPGAQGLVNFVIATLNHDRDTKLDVMKDEFYSAFGAAKEKVKEYFEYMTYVTMKVPFKNPLAVRNNEGGHLMWNMFLMADNIFTPQVMAKATGILKDAAAAPGLDKASAERVYMLQCALENIRLIMAAQVEFRKYKAGAPIKAFDEAVQKLDAYRASIEHTGAINVGHLRYLEDRHWRKNLPIKRFSKK